jgi:hypothetical protein
MEAITMLQSTVNTRQVSVKVEKAFRRWHINATGHRPQGMNTYFEHGQWWVTLLSGAAYSVVDAEGGDAVNGFSFEQVSEGDDA